MAEWWQSMSIIAQVYFCIAVGATVFLLLQSILLFFGVGDSAEPGDFNGSFDGEGLTLFSLRGILAFLTVSGWVGVWLATTNAQAWLIILISTVAGLAAWFILALIMRAITKLQSNGLVELSNAIGKTATVYLRIPKSGTGSGKVTITFSGKFMELGAVSAGDKEFPVSSMVKVVGILGDDLIVDELTETQQPNLEQPDHKDTQE